MLKQLFSHGFPDGFQDGLTTRDFSLGGLTISGLLCYGLIILGIAKIPRQESLVKRPGSMGWHLVDFAVGDIPSYPERWYPLVMTNRLTVCHGIDGP